MPPPPPPAPPPPSSLASSTKAPAVRTKLLSEIHQGTKLKKTVTNDRSAPLIGGKVNASSASDSNGSSSQSGGGAPGKVAVSGGIGALFAGGVPRKPSDVKNLKQVNQSNVSSAPAPPAKIAASMAPKPTAPFSQSKSTLPPSAKNMAVKNGVVSQLQSNLQNNLRIEAPNDQHKNSTSQPPAPPSAKLKPALPAVSASASKPCLPSVGGRPIVKQESVTQMRRPAAPPPPPPGVHSSAYNHQQPSTPHRDRGPLPPPPAGCSSSNTTSSSMSPINMSSHDLTSLRSLNTSCAPSIPPPPPPRVSSCMDSIEQRFHFVPISELPPPPRFIGFKKIYEIGQHRKSTGTAH